MNLLVVSGHKVLSGCFRYQRSAVRIQSSAKLIEHLFTVNCIEKTKIKKKEAGNGTFLKNKTEIQEREFQGRDCTHEGGF